MSEQLREFYRYRALLYAIVWRDIKVRYKQSVMGVLWAVLMPMLIVSAGVMVRYAYTVVANEPLNLDDVLAVSAKSVPWAFLVSAVRSSCQSLISNPGLVSKVYFPKEIFPAAAVISQLFDLAVASVVLAVLFAVAGAGITLHILWAPVLLGVMILLAMGIGLLVSAGSLFFRDVKYLVEVFLTFGIFFVPVFYDVEMFGQNARYLLLNPVAPVLEGFASITRHQHPDARWLIYSCTVAALTAWAAYVIFKRTEPAFAESL